VRRARVTIDLVNRTGAVVTTLVRDRTLNAGPVHLAWNGRTTHGRVLPTARYTPEVSFPDLRRTLRLPSPIALDADRPTVERATIRLGRTIVVRYRFSEPAQAALFIDGTRAVLTRFTPTSGTIGLTSSVGHGRRPLGRADRFSLVAIDLAGNRSRPRTPIQ